MKHLQFGRGKNQYVRLFSAQSLAVFQIAQQGIYRAHSELAREPWDYVKERERLHGLNPIWGYIPASWDLTDYCDGEILERFRCEMSLPQKDSWRDFVVMELLLPEAHVKRGTTHNASPSVVVFPYITAANIVAAYTFRDAVRPTAFEGITPRHYFKVVTPIYTNTQLGEPWVSKEIDFAQAFLHIGEGTPLFEE